MTITIKRAASIGLHLVLALALAAPGFAQDVGATDTGSAFPEGNYRVKTTDGATLRGQLQSLSPETLRILVDGTPREVPMQDVEKVDRPSHGALRGLILGAAAGMVLGAVGNCEPEFNMSTAEFTTPRGKCIAATGIVLGTIGLGVGWLFSRPSVIYRRASVGSR